MIPFLHKEQKQKRKHIEHAMFCVKYARRMKEDELDAETLAGLRETHGELKRFRREKRWEEGAALAEEAIEQTRKLHPAPRGMYGLRENVEVFVVVLAVALGLRTYFLQPYQIPTGSMQPTLYGITADAEYEPNWTDRIPVRWGKFLLTGSRYVEIDAKGSGILPPRGNWRRRDTFWEFDIGGRRHRIHQDYELLVEPGQAVSRGQVIARGLRKQGDHIIVNRFITNFFEPERGDIVVFSTRGVKGVRANSAYIKRLAGMPGERVSICDGKLVAEGEVVRSPWVFERQYEGAGYEGYSNRVPHPEAFGATVATPLFSDCEAELRLGEDEYLYLGGVSGRNIIGSAFFVPWPFFNRGTENKRAGFVD